MQDFEGVLRHNFLFHQISLNKKMKNKMPQDRSAFVCLFYILMKIYFWPRILENFNKMFFIGKKQ